tara:strand:+ start:535 stop:735 length:201 start_codon:yes stop_codon:yes gene_type:complete
MVSLGFEKKIVAVILSIVDKKFGQLKIAGVPIDKITDIFQGQDNKIKDLELRLDALEHFLKEKESS